MNNEDLIRKRKYEKRKRQILINRIIFGLGVLVVIILLALLVRFFVMKSVEKDDSSSSEAITETSESSLVIEESSSLETKVEESSSEIVESSEESSSVDEEPVISEETANKEPEESSSTSVNKVVISDELSATDKTAWNLILVNPWTKLPEDFSVERTQIGNGHSVDSRAYPYLKQMLDDCRAEGLSPLVCSSYRSVDKQIQLFNKQIKKYTDIGYSKKDAEIEAAKWVAVPRTSEHHTGLALDIVATSYQLLDATQENTAEQKWLMANAHKYGFILRFPKDKQDITGIVYEPWHYRFVGVEAAKIIYEKQICLEEYLEEL